MAVHGGEVFRLAAQAGIEPENIIDFSANINPLGLPPGVDKAMRESLKTLANYPEIGAESLCQCVAQRHRLSEENVVVGNGSSALIYLLARVLRPQKALIWAPTFSEYERALSQVQCHISHLKSWDSKKALSLDEIIKSTIAAQPDLVFICNPNNPTGTLWSIA
jgi:threonine-phosphate decarboxylase